MSRAVQFFAPGIPQVYYVGLLAGKNDLEFLESSKEGRNINRHYYTLDEIDQEVERPVVQNIIKLMELRNREPAFSGEFYQEQQSETCLRLGWKIPGESVELTADFGDKRFDIVRIKGGKRERIFGS